MPFFELVNMSNMSYFLKLDQRSFLHFANEIDLV